ncbi:MAG: DUF2946 domain-containing protein [Hyphomicrobium denitrificans]|nr:DUF2946 domain-containing protein [Hyphomicrobium denitrificans]
MTRAGGKRRSTFSAAIALLGVLFYIALVPNHFVSELRQTLRAIDIGNLADLICHTGKSHHSASTHSAPEQGSSGRDSTDCPFCKGLAAFHLAITATPPIVRPTKDIGQTIRAATIALLAIVFTIDTRNRGPPSLNAL